MKDKVKLEQQHYKITIIKSSMVNFETGLSMFELDLPQNICVSLSRAKKSFGKIRHSLLVEYKPE